MPVHGELYYRDQDPGAASTSAYRDHDRFNNHRYSSQFIMINT